MRTLTIAILGTFLLSLFGVESAEARERGTTHEARSLAESACLYLDNADEASAYQACLGKKLSGLRDNVATPL